MVNLDYPRGLHTLTEHCHAWLLPDGSWGWSNAGLIVGDGESLLVDTLFDLPLTREMLDGYAALTAAAPIRRAAITHANGDHYFGNQLLAPDVEIISTAAAAAEFSQEHVTSAQQMKLAEGPVGDFARSVFGPFDFDGIEVRGADRTFDKQLVLDVGGVQVELYGLGPAHTKGDLVVYVPECRTLYAGDLLFIGGTPIAWDGPMDNWIAACDFMIDLDPEFVVPGHGPVTGTDGIRDVRDYLVHVQEQATAQYHAGADWEEATSNIDLGRFGELHEAGRIAQNVLCVYHDLDQETVMPAQFDIVSKIAALEGFSDEQVVSS